jgi:hypothetical protein
MNLIIFASVVILSIAIAIALARSKKYAASVNQDFWAREKQANSTRRKALDDLEYIKIPLEEFPMELPSENPKVDDYKQIIRSLSEIPVVNFTGISNTELKLRYGAPNIDLLTSYDQNYTLLVRTLQQWAQSLYEEGHAEEARRLLEFSIFTGSDVSATYRLLCRIYMEQGTPEKIGDLYPVAETLNSAMQKTIIQILEDNAYQSAVSDAD